MGLGNGGNEAELRPDTRGLKEAPKTMTHSYRHRISHL